MKLKILAIVTGAAGSVLAIYGIIVPGSAGMVLFAFGLMTLLPVPAAILLCRHRVRHGKTISYGTAVASGFGAALLALSIPLILVARYEKWTPEYWVCIFTGYILFSLFCTLPALGVVHHYQGQAGRTDS